MSYLNRDRGIIKQLVAISRKLGLLHNTMCSISLIGIYLRLSGILLQLAWLH